MTTSSHIAPSIEIARNYLAEHPEEARSPGSAASAVMEERTRCRIEGPGGATIYMTCPPTSAAERRPPSPGWLARAARTVLRHRQGVRAAAVRDVAFRPGRPGRRGDLYYDQVSLLTQLGLMPQSPGAQAVPEPDRERHGSGSQEKTDVTIA